MSIQLVTEVALMITAVVGAGGSFWLVVRLLRRVPRFVDQWLDRRADEHARKKREARAIECLIAMQPGLSKALGQLEPNGGTSLYDVVHQADAGLSELRAWVREHVDAHGDLDPVLEGLLEDVEEMKQAAEEAQQ